jgi:hypothetical protein
LTRKGAFFSLFLAVRLLVEFLVEGPLTSLPLLSLSLLFERRVLLDKLLDLFKDRCLFGGGVFKIFFILLLLLTTLLRVEELETFRTGLMPRVDGVRVTG